MKKIISACIAAIMIVCTVALPSAAGCYIPNGTGWDPDDIVTVRRADPGKVVKDGLIGEEEYDRLEFDRFEETTPLVFPYVSSDNLDQALDMLKTIDFYFSWDAEHGINIAIRNKPHVIQQLLRERNGIKTEDDFLHNTAYNLNGATDNPASKTIYFALGKRTDTGAYLEGQWGQLGAQGTYDPEEGVDYIISYGDDGFSTIEWSIPVDVFLKNGGGAGSVLRFSLSAMAGTTTKDDDFSDFYGVALGDRCYAMDQPLVSAGQADHVTYILSDEAVGSGAVPASFDDVEDGAYYANAVKWAVNCGVTKGTTDRLFSPDAGCTRGQAVTFLWRASGSPEPKSSDGPFSDVISAEYYYKAVLWAVENGITKGTSGTEFSPDDLCTRGQIVTFLYRYEKSPTPSSGTNPFGDVKSGDYFFDAVLWAVKEGITKGTSETEFSPGDTCTRGQIVTFLFRDKT
ncbi:MAG: S-layer homology domain-containing protein [Clostridia bacterium]|nr:S-layer homology domain-containing protein [Clostridia bacterium]